MIGKLINKVSTAENMVTLKNNFKACKKSEEGTDSRVSIPAPVGTLVCLEQGNGEHGGDLRFAYKSRA